ncbi:uncharacterized protein C8Q71DRAFT_840724 [Rhodofomes roseus]|uniref:Uncharacterized protein n=1 Tax=Rhodofomes roseus TaxID=34475 RepID=A0ABQ8K5S5_9APHY|nr:uncharacterized protein C8Q71DRAFT_840724 [Rhodofomes roseus]KAH9832303.1 hypothetical protein C8Q71DRAFT_840724 [Rhodofomes roseus]
MDDSVRISPSLNTTKRSGHRVQHASAGASGRLPTDSQLGHRVRIPTDDLDSSEKMAPYLVDSPTADVSLSGPAKLCRAFSAVPQAVEYQFSRQRPLVRLATMVYCVLSCLVFSMAMYQRFFDNQNHVTLYASEISQNRNPLESLPIEHVLSKVTSLYPAPKAVDPFVLKAAANPVGITACLWSTDQDVHSVISWATRWTGPISLLVTTTTDPASPEHEALLRKLATLQHRSALLNTTLSLHLVHLAPSTPPNPNAFLNLARLLAQTPRVVLFPANLTTTPPKLLYPSLLAAHHPSVPSAAIVDASTPAGTARRRPVVLTTRGQTGFPFSPLAPVVLARDDPLWCTERFFAPGERAPDWEECLWQIWLENFGDVEVRQTRGWLHDALPGTTTSAESPSMAKLRRRLVAKFRSETCVLATRQLAALRSADRALDAKKTRWLKRVCRAWTTGPQA